MALIITLIIVGILLIVAEIILIPGIFIAGTLGLAALAGSCYFAFAEYGHVAGAITIAANIILVVLFVILSLRSNTWKKLSLSTKIDSKVDCNPEEKGLSLGQSGITITQLNPMGKAKINNIFVEVTSQGEIIAPNTEIAIVLIEDNRIYVKLK